MLGFFFFFLSEYASLKVLNSLSVKNYFLRPSEIAEVSSSQWAPWRTPLIGGCGRIANLRLEIRAWRVQVSALLRQQTALKIRDNHKLII